MNERILLDTSALIALVLEDDLFHKKAVDFWRKAKLEKLEFFISNFVFDETISWFCQRKGKAIAKEIGEFLLANENNLPMAPVLSEDEQKGWQLFIKLPGRTSFTDCTSFAMMRRLKVKRVFTFDKHFEKAGFKILP